MPDVIVSPKVREFFDYWCARCPKNDIPAWSDIDLMEIYHLSPKIVVKDAIDGGADFRNRFWGTDIVRIHDYDATGRVYADYPELLSAEEEKNIHRSIMRDRAPVQVSGDMSAWRSKNHVRFEGIICPLKDADGEVSIFVAHYAFDLFD